MISKCVIFAHFKLPMKSIKLQSILEIPHLLWKRHALIEVNVYKENVYLNLYLDLRLPVLGYLQW